MDILLFISNFFYRIRYKLFIGTLITTMLVAYFSRFIPKTYTINTSIYTGFASNSGINDSKMDWLQLNNTFDNLINLIKAKKTLENVSIALFAKNMVYGDLLVDNQTIKAQTYRDLIKVVPKTVQNLIDKNSVEKTIENIKQYKKESSDDFFFNLFNQKHPHYSFTALQKISVKRLGNSDILEISYCTNDPGIALTTVKLVDIELVKSYDDLRYKSTSDVVQYYEQLLEKYKQNLNMQENALTDYNIENKIINYPEQTKALAISLSSYEDRYETVKKEMNSSKQLIKSFEEQMSLRQKANQYNADFIKALANVSAINRKITEYEIFHTSRNSSEDNELSLYKQELKQAEGTVSLLSDQINDTKYSKEGIVLDKIMDEWLAATIRFTKACAEIDVLDNRKEEYQRQYEIFSPVGTQLKRKEREISVTERSYLEALEGLNQAKQKEKSIQLESATLTTISPPTYPLFSDKGKTSILVMASFLGSFFFIFGFSLLVELSDRTLRDPERAKRLTKIPVLGVFMGRKQLKYRGYRKAINRKIISNICTSINSVENVPTIINLISVEKGEGKSYIAKYMMDYWKSTDIKAKYISYVTDFMPISKKYIYAQTIKDLITPLEKGVDVLLIEYPPLNQGSIPAPLLQEAHINLLVVNAKRVWKESDNIQVQLMKDKTSHLSIQLILNNTYRGVIEDFIGQLPPYVKKGQLYRIFQLGLTAEEANVQ